MGPLLDLLDRHGSRGTFFVLDAVARLEPGLVRDIARRGHEVASHGYAHRHLAEQSAAAFRTGMADARDRLAELIGAAPLGFRAPYFSLTPKAAWVPEILAELGFAYSSSLLPARNPLAGWPGAPRDAFRWPSGLVELPVPVARTGMMTLPFLGGMYLRWLTPWRLGAMARAWAEHGGVLWSYCHPYDLDTAGGAAQPPQASALVQLMLWLNRGVTLPRLEGLLAGRQSVPFAARLREVDVPVWVP